MSERKEIRKGRIRKALMGLLAVGLMVGLLPTTAFAADKAVQLGTATTISGGQASSVYFGTYKQSGSKTSGFNIEPIKWRVLQNANSKLFLLSDQNIDLFQYHVDNESVTWEKSTMRSWLNGYDASYNTGGSSGVDYSSDNFLANAFSSKEQAAIATTYVYNATQSDGTSRPNPNLTTSGGNNTNDKIFLLSYEEATKKAYGFSGNTNRLATNTAYTASGGTKSSTSSSIPAAGAAGYWWLRSPGYYTH